MFKLRKNAPIIVLLRDRELGPATRAQKLGFNILSSMIRWTGASFAETWRHSCRKPAFCKEDKLYLHDYSKCLSLWGTNNLPCPLYDLGKSVQPIRIIDIITCTQTPPTSAMRLDEPSTYKETLIVFLDDNRLQLYNQETGEFVRSIYLGDFPGYCSFKQCEWDIYPEQFTVTWIFKRLHTRASTVSSAGDNRPNYQRDRFAVIAVFSVFPLEFIAMLELNNSTFGKNISRAKVKDGILMIGTGLTRHGTVELYDFNEIIDKNLLFKARLGDSCDHCIGQVGSFPSGLPMNCVIKHIPPVLFSVDCADFHVTFGLIPFHYAMKLSNSAVYQIRRLSDNEVPESSCIKPTSKDCETNPFKYDTLDFHFDSSNRIIYKRAFDVTVYGYSPEKASVEKLFTIDFQTKSCLEMNSEADFVGKYVHETRCIACMDYEDDLDLIAVLGFSYNDPLCVGMVKIYDNFTGKMVKLFTPNLKIDDDDMGYELSFFWDTIVITEGHRYPRSLCVVYKLSLIERHFPLKKYTKCR